MKKGQEVSIIAPGKTWPGVVWEIKSETSIRIRHEGGIQTFNKENDEWLSKMPGGMIFKLKV